jgi:hypothetical protein
MDLGGRRRGSLKQMPEIVSDAPYATFINTFRCRPSDQDEVVRGRDRPAS